MMFRSFSIWFSLNALGVKTFRDVLERNLQLAQYAYHQLKPISKLYVSEPDMSVVIFRCVGDTVEEANHLTCLLLREMENNELVFLSPTNMDGYKYIRIAVCNYRSHLTEIKMAIEQVRMGVRT